MWLLVIHAPRTRVLVILGENICVHKAGDVLECRIRELANSYGRTIGRVTVTENEDSVTFDLDEPEFLGGALNQAVIGVTILKYTGVPPELKLLELPDRDWGELHNSDGTISTYIHSIARKRLPKLTGHRLWEGILMNRFENIRLQNPLPTPDEYKKLWLFVLCHRNSEVGLPEYLFRYMCREIAETYFLQAEKRIEKYPR